MCDSGSCQMSAPLISSIEKNHYIVLFCKHPLLFKVSKEVLSCLFLKDGYKSVFVGTGAWRPRRLLIPGETFGNVHYAINYLNNPDVYDL